MKKYILLFISIFVLFAQNIYAIGYNGSSIPNYPTVDPSWRFSYYPWIYVHNWNEPWSSAQSNCSVQGRYQVPLYCSEDWATKRATWWWFVEFNTTDFATWTTYVQWFWWYQSYWYVGGWLSYKKNTTWKIEVNIYVFDQNWTKLVDTVSSTASWYLFTIPSSNFASWALPNRFSTFLSVEYWKTQTIYANSSVVNSFWFREMNFCFYLNDVGSNVCFTKTYLSSQYPDWLFLGNWQNIWEHWIYNNIPWSSTFFYLPTSWQWMNSAWNKLKYLEFTTFSSGSWSSNSSYLTNWYWWSSTYYVAWGITTTSSWWWSGTTSSWFWSYYSSCTSFIDVGCYISGTATRFADAWIDAKNTVIDWIFPDINFNGLSSTCLTGSGNLSVSGSLSSLPFMQKFVNIFAVAIPIAPLQDSQVCTIDGSVKTIHYGRTVPTVVDWLIILMCIVPIFFSVPHKPPNSKA